MRHLISASEIAYLGPEFTFSYYAAKALQNETVTLKNSKLSPMQTLNDVFEHIEQNGASTLGIVAFENNVEGMISLTLDLLSKYPNLKACGSLTLPIDFIAVYKKARSTMPFYTNVYAHPHALAQCQSFINKNRLKAVEVNSNTAKVEQLAEGEIAIVPKIFDYKALDLLQFGTSSVADFLNAKTSFLIISKRNMQDTEHIRNDVAYLYEISPKLDSPGTLLNILKPISDSNINIFSLNSRPQKGKDGVYSFFLVIDSKMPDALQNDELKFLGFTGVY